MVTDNASNMILSAQLLHLRHVPCFAHNLNLIVKKALDQTPVINEIRQKDSGVVQIQLQSKGQACGDAGLDGQTKSENDTGG